MTDIECGVQGDRSQAHSYGLAGGSKEDGCLIAENQLLAGGAADGLFLEAFFPDVAAQDDLD